MPKGNIVKTENINSLVNWIFKSEKLTTTTTKQPTRNLQLELTKISTSKVESMKPPKAVKEKKLNSVQILQMTGISQNILVEANCLLLCLYLTSSSRANYTSLIAENVWKDCMTFQLKTLNGLRKLKYII